MSVRTFGPVQAQPAFLYFQAEPRLRRGCGYPINERTSHYAGKQLGPLAPHFNGCKPGGSPREPWKAASLSQLLDGEHAVDALLDPCGARDRRSDVVGGRRDHGRPRRAGAQSSRSTISRTRSPPSRTFGDLHRRAAVSTHDLDGSSEPTRLVPGWKWRSQDRPPRLAVGRDAPSGFPSPGASHPGSAPDSRIPRRRRVV